MKLVNFSKEDLTKEEDLVVTLSNAGYVKAQPVDIYTSQKRGGRGKTAATVKDEDFIEKFQPPKICLEKYQNHAYRKKLNVEIILGANLNNFKMQMKLLFVFVRRWESTFAKLASTKSHAAVPIIFWKRHNFKQYIFEMTQREFQN